MDMQVDKGHVWLVSNRDLFFINNSKKIIARAIFILLSNTIF